MYQKIPVSDCPKWVQDTIRAHGKRPKSIYMSVVASNSTRECSATAGAGEQTYTYVFNGVIKEAHRSSWGGANPFVPKTVNEFPVTFTPGKQVLVSDGPKFAAFFLYVASVDPLVSKMLATAR